VDIKSANFSKGVVYTRVLMNWL